MAQALEAPTVTAPRGFNSKKRDDLIDRLSH